MARLVFTAAVFLAAVFLAAAFGSVACSDGDSGPAAPTAPTRRPLARVVLEDVRMEDAGNVYYRLHFTVRGRPPSGSIIRWTFIRGAFDEDFHILERLETRLRSDVDSRPYNEFISKPHVRDWNRVSARPHYASDSPLFIAGKVSWTRQELGIPPP